MAGFRRGGLATALAMWLVAYCGAATAAQATPGSVDPSFATGGFAIADLGSEDVERDMAVDSQGRVVVIGDIEGVSSQKAVAVRYTAAGALDPAFGGGDGIVPFHFGTAAYDDAAAVAIDGSNRVVIAGSARPTPACNTGCELAVARLTDGGQFDSSFAGDGTLLTGIGGGGQTVAIDGSGRIVVGGSSVLVRLTEYGILDSSFSDDGMTTEGNGAELMALDGIGRIVSGTGLGIAIDRFLPSGGLDPTFDGDGLASTHIAPGSSDYPTPDAMAVDTDNRILVAGITFLAGSEIDGQPFIVRLTETGALDTSFDADGIILGTDEGRFADVAIDSEGRYLVVGYADDLAPESDILIRYLPNGSLDTSFGNGSGFVPVPSLLGSDVSTDSEQHILIAGGAYGENLDFRLGRYLGSTEPPPQPPVPPAPPQETSPAPPLVAVSGTPNLTARAKKCRKGFRKKRVHGKVRCIRRKPRRSGLR